MLPLVPYTHTGFLLPSSWELWLDSGKSKLLLSGKVTSVLFGVSSQATGRWSLDLKYYHSVHKGTMLDNHIKKMYCSCLNYFRNSLSPSKVTRSSLSTRRLYTLHVSTMKMGSQAGNSRGKLFHICCLISETTKC